MENYVLVNFENVYMDLYHLNKDFTGFCIFKKSEWLSLRRNFLDNQKQFFVENILISNKLNWMRNYKVKDLTEVEYKTLLKIFGNYLEHSTYGQFIHLN